MFSNLDKIKKEATWNEETERWRVPDLVTQKTKLPPAGKIHIIVAVLYLSEVVVVSKWDLSEVDKWIHEYYCRLPYSIQLNQGVESFISANHFQ